MKKEIIKKTIIGLMLIVTLLLTNTPQVNAAGSTKTVTTQKQLLSALKDKKVDKIVIKPKKESKFSIEKKSYNKDLVVYQKYTLLVNKGAFKSSEVIVTNNSQATKAVENMIKYHRSVENRLIIKNAKSDIILPKANLSGFASLRIEGSNCDVTNKASWGKIEIKDMGAGDFCEYGEGNSIIITGDLGKLEIAEEARIYKILYNQKYDLQNTINNYIEINGSIDQIVTASDLDLYITGSNLKDINDAIRNDTEHDIVIYVEDNKYIFDPDSNLVIEEAKEDPDFRDEEIEFSDKELDYDENDLEFNDEDIDFGDEDRDFYNEESDSDYDYYADTNAEASDDTDKVMEDNAHNYTEYTIELGDGTSSTVYGYFDEEASSQVFMKVNELRASLGLSSLKWDTGMLACAKIRASELIQLYSHTRPNGNGPFTVFSSNGVSYRSAGENIAAGYRSAEAVMEGWTDSPGHYANMTNAGFDNMIVGCIIAKDNSDTQGYKYYWVQMFRK